MTDKEAQLVEELPEAYVYLITKYPTESSEGELNPLGGEGSDGDQQGDHLRSRGRCQVTSLGLLVGWALMRTTTTLF